MTDHKCHPGDAEWQHHEHVSEQAQLQAQKLIDETGTPALAKKAIELADDRREAHPLSIPIAGLRLLSVALRSLHARSCAGRPALVRHTVGERRMDRVE